MGSLPGGGAEILVDRVRREVSPGKVSADDWLDVCRLWHELGGRGSATMMFGHVETLPSGSSTSSGCGSLQDETGGFTAFICWTFQPGNTDLADVPQGWGLRVPQDAGRQPAVSRQLRQPPVQLGHARAARSARLALRFGANDMGSLMIEENVVAAAGTSFRTTEAEIRRAIARGRLCPPTEECVLSNCVESR